MCFSNDKKLGVSLTTKNDCPETILLREVNAVKLQTLCAHRMRYKNKVVSGLEHRTFRGSVKISASDAVTH